MSLQQEDIIWTNIALVAWELTKSLTPYIRKKCEPFIKINLTFGRHEMRRNIGSTLVI